MIEYTNTHQLAIPERRFTGRLGQTIGWQFAWMQSNTKLIEVKKEFNQLSFFILLEHRAYVFRFGKSDCTNLPKVGPIAL
jgi:hypothetical protein